jgi:epoxyqueuosine reductase
MSNAPQNKRPPAFEWEKWYEAAGGRSIELPEVEAILKEIYEDQWTRFEGKIADVKQEFSSPHEASEIIKSKAQELGADMVGICEIEASDIYEGRESEVTEKFAIALGEKMLWRAFQKVPSNESAVECVRVYHRLGEVAIALAEYIRSLGYSCKIEHPIGDADLLHIPIGLKAGFGELGRHGSIIHPKWGPLFRMGSVTTSIELATDSPVDVGIAEFCDKCKACRIYCPANAIPDERSFQAGKDHLGKYRYQVDTGKCFPYFAKYNYCSICLPVCVYNHKEWARDFEGHETKLFPEILMEEAPDPVEIEETLRHEYNRLHRDQDS